MPTNKHRRERSQPTPSTSVTLAVPENCRMRGVFHGHHDIRITLGKHANGVTLKFGRLSLHEFARLALELLAVPPATDPPNVPVRIVKPGPQKVPDLTGEENSAFIVLLHQVRNQLEPYARWLLHPEDADTEQLGFADQLLLSMVMSALGDGMRELAYDRASQDELLTASDTFDDRTHQRCGPA